MTTPRIVPLCLGLVLLLTSPVRGEEEEAGVIENGRTVSIEYTLTLDDGSVADSNVGAEPLVYQQGEQQILPALETSLLGLAVNDSKQVALTAEQAYGPVIPEAVQSVPLDAIPEDARHAGATLVSQSPEGQRRIVRVRDVSESEIVLDLNHPLAGQALNFDVRVIAIE
jgi:FKBP-type peptidyl-prolyl cis-trans isomerase 2